MAEENKVIVRRCGAGEEVVLSIVGQATFYEAFGFIRKVSSCANEPELGFVKSI